MGSSKGSGTRSARTTASTLWEAPDNVSMAVVALALSGGGAISSLEDDRAPHVLDED